MGLRRERKNLANILHLDPCRSVSAPRRDPSHRVSDWRYGYGRCNRQPRGNPRTHLNNPPTWDSRSNVLWILRKDRPIRTTRLASIRLRRGTHTDQRDSSRCNDRNRWIRYRQNSHHNIPTIFPYLFRLLRRLGPYINDLR